MRRHFVTAILLSTLAPAPILAQDAPTGDPVIQRIYQEGMQRSHASALAQVLMDSIGPRLTGSPQNRSAND
jgi:carboxypeptidase Q